MDIVTVTIWRRGNKKKWYKFEYWTVTKNVYFYSWDGKIKDLLFLLSLLSLMQRVKEMRERERERDEHRLGKREKIFFNFRDWYFSCFNYTSHVILHLPSLFPFSFFLSFSYNYLYTRIKLTEKSVCKWMIANRTRSKRDQNGKEWKRNKITVKNLTPRK